MRNRSAARRARDFVLIPSPFEQRARGIPGAQCTRRSPVCAGVVEYARGYLQRRHRKHSAFPTQWFYGLIRDLPGDRAFLPPSFRRRSRIAAWLGSARLSAKLDTSVGVSGPHDFAVRNTAARLARADHSRIASPLRSRQHARQRRVHRIPPNVRDDSRSAPVRPRRECARGNHIFLKNGIGIFSRGD
jgi:hypothetical protein